MNSISVIILAAGRGTRMHSKTTKILHDLCGKPLLYYSVKAALALKPREIICVLGHQAEAVMSMLKTEFVDAPIKTVIQKQQLGTGHAVNTALPVVSRDSTHVLILCGDTPLIKTDQLELLINATQSHILGLLSTTLKNPTGYGRLLRDGQGKLQRIIEEKDADATEKNIKEINAGIYFAQLKFLKNALVNIQANNAQKEFYLTDVIEKAAAEQTIVTPSVPFDDVRGVNDRYDLAQVEMLLQQRILEQHLRDGVTIHNWPSVTIQSTVILARDVEIGAFVSLRGNTTVESGCKIDTGCVLTDVIVKQNCVLKPYTIAQNSTIGEDSQVGPFSHLRPMTQLQKNTRIGNFVELKNTVFGENSKANHLSYLGDAEIGESVNIGCGTITCNYDGFAKHKTTIHDGVFVGSDTQFIAPVEIGKNAVIAAGTTVTENVPADSLALSRVKQINKLNYSERRRKK